MMALRYVLHLLQRACKEKGKEGGGKGDRQGAWARASLSAASLPLNPRCQQQLQMGQAKARKPPVRMSHVTT